jgi:hypothetical protein
VDARDTVIECPTVIHMNNTAMVQRTFKKQMSAAWEKVKLPWQLYNSSINTAGSIQMNKVSKEKEGQCI